jgi:aspartyl-tRNA(Asn)/glutamyl-tRNA(Gln) amidotransferase subunit A
VSNPWNTDCVPGGSSGGSAAAVAAGLVAAATGTDTGGSIRQPAALCGITGLKPTYGRVSRYGMIAFASSLDQAGPMTRDAEDAALMLSVMAGFDHRDSTSAQRDDSWLAELAVKGIPELDQPLTIGLPDEYFRTSEHMDALEMAKAELQKLGHTFKHVSLPHTESAIPVYYVLASAEASTNLSRYDGVRFGHRCENPQSLQDLYERSREEGFGQEVKRRILTGTYTLSVGYFDAYYLKAQKIRRLIAQDFTNVFAEVDLVLAPTAPTPAFKKNQLTDDPVAMYQQDLYTVPTSLAGLPAMSVPCGFSQGLPMGMQLIAPAFREDLPLMLAAQFQRHTDWHRRRPGDAS